MFKKVGVIFACFLFLLQVKAVSAATYVDVPESHWAYAAISTVTEKGYMFSEGDGTFRPNAAATRAEAAQAIATSITVKVPADFKLNFKDVTTEHPFYENIRALVFAGVIQNAEYFHPDGFLTRSHIAKMLALAYQIEVDSKNNTRFVDYPASYWAKNYIESLADIGIVKGVTTTKFSPLTYVTRAQLAALIVRGQSFQQKVINYEMIYDYLSKNYLSTTNYYKAWTREVVKLVNEQRNLKKLPPLQEDPALTQLTIIKAQDMIQRHYFEHKSPFYGNPWDMATLFDYEYTSFGENIARGFTSPKAVVQAWMNSEKHRENILRTNYTNIGVGVKKDTKDNLIWVQQFSSN